MGEGVAGDEPGGEEFGVLSGEGLWGKLLEARSGGQGDVVWGRRDLEEVIQLVAVVLGHRFGGSIATGERYTPTLIRV